MKNPILFAILTTLTLNAPYAVAQTAPKTEGKPAAMAMDKQMPQMHEKMKRMQHEQMMQGTPAK